MPARTTLRLRAAGAHACRQRAADRSARATEPQQRGGPSRKRCPSRTRFQRNDQTQKQNYWFMALCNAPMHPMQLFEANLPLVERAIARVCRDCGLTGADAEDFASSARIALMANDCAILRQYQGRSSLASYLTIVIRRLLVDQRRAVGRWVPSSEARRHGTAGLLLEHLLHRDGRSLRDAVAIAAERHRELTHEQLERIAAGLPDRVPRVRFVEFAEGSEDRFAAVATADERVADLDRRRRGDGASATIREAMSAMTAEDRLILRLRFVKERSIADIARALQREQRPLYRRIEALLGVLRHALERAGFEAAAIADLIGAAREPLNFGAAFRKTDETVPSGECERRRSGEEES
jgi:RNA polymerase sigma factor (sigma-70 family)